MGEAAISSLVKRSRAGDEKTLQTRVYAELRDSILNGDFEPGSSVTIRGLAADLGVSMMPVREALRRLTTERALQLSATGRVSVPVMTRQKLAELVSARVCLEKQAALTALPQVKPADIKRLRRCNTQIDIAIERGDHRGYLQTHREFHFRLYALGPSEVFLPLIESVWLQVSPFLKYTLSLEHLTTYNNQDRHVDVIEALEAGDATALGFAIEADIRQGLGSLTEADWEI